MRACVHVVSFFHLFQKKQAGWMVQSFFWPDALLSFNQCQLAVVIISTFLKSFCFTRFLISIWISSVLKMICFACLMRKVTGSHIMVSSCCFMSQVFDVFKLANYDWKLWRESFLLCLYLTAVCMCSLKLLKTDFDRLWQTFLISDRVYKDAWKSTCSKLVFLVIYTWFVI